MPLLKRFSSLPIRHKLVRMIMTSSLLILVLGTTALLSIEIYRMRNGMLTDVSILADIAGSTCAAPLLFQDEKAAIESLNAMKHHPGILRASVLDTRGAEFAVYTAPEFNETTRGEQFSGAGHLFTLKRLYLYREIIVKKERVGFISIIYDLGEIYQRVFEYLMLMLVLFVGMAFLSRVLANKLQEYVSLPIQRLGETACKVSESEDYSIRASKENDDETGVLADRFNEMLSLVQERDQRLATMMGDLEEKVRLRTADLEAEKDKAEKAVLVKSNFLANMSHEIRTPMIGVIGMAELLREQNLSPDNLSMVETIYHSGDSLLTILNDILDFSKIEAGRLELRPTATDLLKLAREVVGLLGIGAKAKGIELELDIPAELPYVMADPVRFRQILINLVGNAVKFTEAGKVSLSLSITENGTEGLCDCHIRVKDTGVGIREELHLQIFESFTQGDGDHVLTSSGTGLGLTIVKDLATLMNGTIRVDSTPGEGSTFSVFLSLPLAGELAQHPSSLLTDSPVCDFSHTSVFGKQRPRILLAEDNPATQKLLSILLPQMSFDLSVVDNGIDAIDLFGRETFDLILMDCQMPKLDGLKATARLRAMGVTTPIIALTAAASSEDRQKCLAAGMDDFLSKPFKRPQLRELLVRWIQSKSS